MAEEFEMPEDFAGGGYVDAPCTVHAVVVEVKESQGPKGGVIDGNTFVLHVLAATDPNQVGRQHTECMFNPNLSNKDGGMFTRKQLAAFYIACNLVDPSQRGKRVALDVTKAQDQQMILKLSRDDYNSNKKGYDIYSLDGLQVFHVDDPRVASIPKDADAIKLIPAEKRHDAAWFEQFKPKGESASTPAQRQPVGAGVNLDDL